MTDQSCCLVNSDAPQGAGTACATPEACCFSDNTCQMLDPLCCVEQGGTTHGQGSVCAGMEGCCDGDACYMADRSCCLANGDTPQGTGTACTVPQACCLQGGAVCFDIDPLCCAELGDDVQGEGSACRGDANGDGIDDACLQLGACCDAGSGLPGGATCSTTTMLDCRCPTCTWYEGRSCQELENDDLCLVNAIPTVSEWGLVIMTLLLLTGAKVYLGVR